MTRTISTAVRRDIRHNQLLTTTTAPPRSYKLIAPAASNTDPTVEEQRLKEESLHFPDLENKCQPNTND